MTPPAFDVDEVRGRLECPPWCTLRPGHDLDELPSRRTHQAPTPTHVHVHVHVSMDDRPVPPERDRRWYAEITELEIHEDTAQDLASAPRRVAADVSAAAEWLEALQ